MSTLSNRPSRTWILVAALAVAASARADVTIDSQLSVVGDPSALTGAYRTRYHGGLARTDRPDGTYVLYDLKRDRLTVVDPAHRSYYTVDRKKYLDLNQSVPPKLRNQFDVVATDNVLRPLSTDEIQTIAGLSTIRVGFTGTVQLVPKQLTAAPPMPNMDNRPVVPGAPPVAPKKDEKKDDKGKPAIPPVEAPPPSETTGNLWVAPAKSLGLGGKQIALPILDAAMGTTPFLGNLMDVANGDGQMPLSLSFVVTRPPAGGGAGPATITYDFLVKAIDKAPVAADAFDLPAGFTQTEAPKPTLIAGLEPFEASEKH